MVSAPVIGKDPKIIAKYLILYGALGGTRTPDTLVRSQVLYPAELRAHGDVYSVYLPVRVVGRIGVEPMTHGLKAHCSTD